MKLMNRKKLHVQHKWYIFRHVILQLCRIWNSAA